MTPNNSRKSPKPFRTYYFWGSQKLGHRKCRHAGKREPTNPEDPWNMFWKSGIWDQFLSKTWNGHLVIWDQYLSENMKWKCCDTGEISSKKMTGDVVFSIRKELKQLKDIIFSIKGT